MLVYNNNANCHIQGSDNIDYKLIDANNDDKDTLIQYKLASIFDYAESLSEDEIRQIKKYVNENVPKQIDKYKIIFSNNKNIGCFLINDYEDGVLLDEIYLIQDYRGKVIGSNILKDVISNCNKIYLWVYKNNINAINIYRNFGFIEIEETESRVKMKYER
ncbi:MAG: GNAT family N-acetyltransferase [Erysipelotrichales bacterium]|nr:GNAT family N-acetyltransferase [Erysipelotrichales bacterium]